MTLTLNSLISTWFIAYSIVQFVLFTDPVLIELKTDEDYTTAWLEVSETVYTSRFPEQSIRHGGWDLYEFKDTFDWLADEKNLCLDLDNPTSVGVTIHRNKEPSPLASVAHALEFIPGFKDIIGTQWPDRYILKVDDYSWTQWKQADITSMDAFNVTLPMVSCV